MVSKTGDFDIRFIGAIHSLILLVTFWLFLPLVAGMRPLFRNVLLGFVTLAYTDVMYISYLNSFYMDTAGMLFGLAAIVFFLRSVLCRSVYDRWLLLASLTLMVTSKTQHYPLGVILTGFHLWKGNLLATQRWFGPLAAAILGAATAVSVGSAPADYAALGGYTVVFNQILPDSPHIEADMEDLRLRPSDRQFIGTHAYQDEAGLRDPVFKERYLKDTPYWRLGWFLLAHPQQAIQVASARLSEAGRQRPRRGNFDPSAGLPPSTESKAFAIWSGTKARNLEGHGGRYLAWVPAVGGNRARPHCRAKANTSLGNRQRLGPALRPLFSRVDHRYVRGRSRRPAVIFYCSTSSVTHCSSLPSSWPQLSSKIKRAKD